MSDEIMQLHEKYPRSSSFYIFSNCEASYELQQAALAAGEEPATLFSDRGTQVHAVLAGRVDPALVDDAAVELAAELDSQDKSLAQKLYHKEDIDEEKSETRLWLRNGLFPVYSGQPDRWTLFERNAIYLRDFKSGWHPLDHYVATNSQLHSYVALLDEHYEHKIQTVIAQIIKPGRKSSPAMFDRQAVHASRMWAVAVVDRVTRAGPKTPKRGPWCTYCAGKSLCPLWAREIQALAPMIDAHVCDIPDLVLREMAPKLSLAATVIDKLQARLKARVKERPELFPDWRFAPGDPRRSIQSRHNADALASLVHKKQLLSLDEFLGSAQLAITRIESAIAKSQKVGRAAAAELMAAALGDLMEKVAPEPHLVYDPPGEAEREEIPLQIPADQSPAEDAPPKATKTLPTPDFLLSAGKDAPF
jgi:hypothetical protein